MSNHSVRSVVLALVGLLALSVLSARADAQTQVVMQNSNGTSVNVGVSLIVAPDEQAAYRFRPTASFRLESIQIPIGRLFGGASTDLVTMTLTVDAGGGPGGVIEASTQPVSVTGTAAHRTLYFDTRPQINAGTTYFLWFTSTNSLVWYGSLAGNPAPTGQINFVEARFQSTDFPGSWFTASQNPGLILTGTPLPIACCNPATGGCTLVANAAACSSFGGVPQSGTTCSPNPCPGPPTPTGACCTGLNCTVTTQSACGAGVYLGNGSTCSPAVVGGPMNVCGRADFDANAQVNADDIFAFLNRWFAGLP